MTFRRRDDSLPVLFWGTAVTLASSFMLQNFRIVTLKKNSTNRFKIISAYSWRSAGDNSPELSALIRFHFGMDYAFTVWLAMVHPIGMYAMVMFQSNQRRICDTTLSVSIVSFIWSSSIIRLSMILTCGCTCVCFLPPCPRCCGFAHMD